MIYRNLSLYNINSDINEHVCPFLTPPKTEIKRSNKHTNKQTNKQTNKHTKRGFLVHCWFVKSIFSDSLLYKTTVFNLRLRWWYSVPFCSVLCIPVKNCLNYYRLLLLLTLLQAQFVFLFGGLGWKPPPLFRIEKCRNDTKLITDGSEVVSSLWESIRGLTLVFLCNFVYNLVGYNNCKI